ncbi:MULTISPECIES: PadR family transcriptional regulator [Metallosphaera]|uniref:Transcriptional regulator, PadR family n=3 Tax=Metallosphaera TaxID=41980 RepID=A4YE88_METS5|nr:MULTISPECIES: PadR family transcriptional regulator [Metallosphaera]ABP94740.1 transcriptional regulator, PadR family [Metallosphaera sedula DSM 5348]AIM26727.1 transcriptional regulator, PadR family [Metallosphaera sedula]AKV73683.1 PadR family transcriptional regulator [Metallosphaera sedula]AKV75923.1 PadR family transcriptional regulator [Metallosphaera sedula]AKV78174.1 PadR family transcriptional regulator [Metallosphaera sedula]
MKMNLERLRRGALKFLIMDALHHKPMHAYEIMKTIEGKFNGVYKPSPGSLYPVLKNLIREGLVKVEERDGKKVYSLTDEGLKKWTEAKANINSILSTPVDYKKLVSMLFDISLVLYSYRDKMFDEKVYNQVSSALLECRAKIERILESQSNESR